jgi:hypothetical protein
MQRFKEKASPRDVIRALFAVSMEYSWELDSLLQIVLTKPVYAWKGIARYQNDRLLRVIHMGGAEQLYLPNLSAGKDGLASDVAHLHCFTSTDWLI